MYKKYSKVGNCLNLVYTQWIFLCIYNTFNIPEDSLVPFSSQYLTQLVTIPRGFFHHHHLFTSVLVLHVNRIIHYWFFCVYPLLLNKCLWGWLMMLHISMVLYCIAEHYPTLLIYHNLFSPSPVWIVPSLGLILKLLETFSCITFGGHILLNPLGCEPRNRDSGP